MQMKKDKMTPAQREAKRERDRRYRENKKAKLVGKTKSASLKAKVKLGKESSPEPKLDKRMLTAFALFSAMINVLTKKQ